MKRSKRPLKRVDIRKLTNGVQIGSLRLFYRPNWRSKPHPYWFARNWDTIATVQSGPVEVFWYKPFKE